MLIKVRSWLFLKEFSLKVIVLILTSSTFLLAGQPEVIPLSDNIGTTLDAEENAILGVFPNIDGFENAQFFQHSINRYSSRIVYRERNRQKNIRRKYNFSQFNQMRNKVKDHPEITEEMRVKFHYELSYLRVDDILKSIPPNSFTTVNRYDGLPVTGRYIKFADKKLRLKQVLGEKVIPITNIEEITYRPIAEEGNTKLQVFTFTAMGIFGLGAGELLNFFGSSTLDETWNHRFSGTILGLVAGMPVYDFVELMTSPKEHIAFAPSEVKGLE